MTHDYGRFVWFELVSNNKDRAARFYSEVTGWKVDEMDMAAGIKYSAITTSGAHIGGYVAPPSKDIPPHWVSYVSVENVDRSAKKVIGAGGRALMEAFDVPGVGRMQPMADPNGASFFLFHNASGDPAAPEGPGSIHWNELVTSSPEAAVAFYEKALGYTHDTVDMGGATYFVLKNGDAPRGGIQQAQGDAPDHWQQFVTVDDCDAAIERAQKSGGSVAVPAVEMAGVGRFAIVRDPVGATIGLIKPS